MSASRNLCGIRRSPFCNDDNRPDETTQSWERMGDDDDWELWEKDRGNWELDGIIIEWKSSSDEGDGTERGYNQHRRRWIIELTTDHNSFRRPCLSSR